MVKGTTLREKDKVFTLTIPIQHSIGSPGQSNQIWKINNINKNFQTGKEIKLSVFSDTIFNKS